MKPKTIKCLREIKTFDLTYWYSRLCNYTCSYCITGNHSYHNCISLQDIDWVTLLSILQKERPDKTVVLTLTGKEPTLVPTLYGDLLYLLVLSKLKNNFKVLVQTNLSLNLDKLKELCRGLPPGVIQFTCAFHKQFAHFPEWLAKVKYLHSKGLLEVAKVLFFDSSDLAYYEQCSNEVGESNVELTWVYQKGMKPHTVCFYPKQWQDKSLLIDGYQLKSVLDLLQEGVSYKGMKCAISSNSMIIDYKGNIYGSCGHALQNLVTTKHLYCNSEEDLITYLRTPWVICPNDFCWFDGNFNNKETA